MSDLSPRERELVALGAAMGSNCVPCIEFHIPESRKAGLSDLEIHVAILHADKIRQVPARKTLQTALNLLPSVAEVGETGMMSKMMATCSTFTQSASTPKSSENKPTVNPETSAGCGCS